MFRDVLRAFTGSGRRDLGGSFNGYCFFDPDCLQPSGGQLQRVSLSSRFVAPPKAGALSSFDLLGQSHGDQLRGDLPGCGTLQTRRSGDAVVLALCGGPEHQELRVGEFNGHDFTLRVWELGLSGPSPGRAPDRCDRRGEGVSAGHSRPRGRPHTRSLSKETPVFSARWRAHLAGEVIKLRIWGWIRISGRHANGYRSKADLQS